ncbi:hypothetical protein BAU15_00145 [Enterococcus sp. JM4C]|uniref:competence type IV pilus minor pilin ComGG n=1 Tax=Candidatus Enterococcus huntleyi TaxID=1857217 RepID=UPI00137A5C12|nr:competence type IV pilus minor pilin ComGG [Enterococcus sp. JM4C]KAF1299091.1 hypothetical protein BAU15_00145 [Enterococcus sp. JM4C]
MDTNTGVNGKFQNKQHGGIFLSVLLFFSLTTSLLILILEDEKLTSDFTIRTTNLYYAKTMKELFLIDYYQQSADSKTVDKTTDEQSIGLVAEEPSEKGKRLYNKGELTYQIVAEKINITIKIDGNYYNFEEKVQQPST